MHRAWALCFCKPLGRKLAGPDSASRSGVDLFDQPRRRRAADLRADVTRTSLTASGGDQAGKQAGRRTCRKGLVSKPPVVTGVFSCSFSLHLAKTLARQGGRGCRRIAAHDGFALDELALRMVRLGRQEGCETDGGFSIDNR